MFEHRSGHVAFVVHIAALEQVFPEYFGFPWHSYHLSSGAGQIVINESSEFSPTPPEETKINK
jgi:hypothetical protein